MKTDKTALLTFVIFSIATLTVAISLSLSHPASESTKTSQIKRDNSNPPFAITDSMAAPGFSHAGSKADTANSHLSQTQVAPDPTSYTDGSPSIDEDEAAPSATVRSVQVPSAPSNARESQDRNTIKSDMADTSLSGSLSPAFHLASSTTAAILAGKDLSVPEQRAMAVEEMQKAENARYAAVLAKAKQLGVPVRVEGSDSLRILHDFRGDEPLYRTTLNANAAISTAANLIRQTAPYNLSGTGIKVGVWDGGSVRNTHQEFTTNRVIKRNPGAPNDDHATHVAGTIGATGFQNIAKGMAPLVAIDSYDWNSDYSEMTAAGAASATNTTAIPISNHSYGFLASAADMGRYETNCNATDALAASMPYYLIFWAAGNEQQDYGLPFGGYQSITFNGLAKNVMTIGAANDAVTSAVRDVTKGTLASFSSMGPSDDGRIKPDLVANGVGVYSPTATASNSYENYNGTSMATPNASGSAALLQELYRTNFSGQFMRASTLKALLIHTADDLGRPGPDYQYGWGYMNAKAAADIILAHKNNPSAPKLIENSINAANRARTNTFVWDGLNPIRATLAWTDPAGAAQTDTNSRTRNLVNDLDLRITAPDGTTTFLPYVMPYVGTWTTASMTNSAVRGTNRVDNVERVDIPAPQAGTYTVTVGMYGNNTLSGTNQVYSLVVTGGQGSPPTPTPTPTPTPPPTSTVAFASVDVPRLIPDNSSTGVTSANNVNLAGTISALTASVNITHTYKGDLRVTLISPAGRSVSLHDRTGSSQDNVILVDVPVSAFNNTSATGQWRLRVQDLSRNDTGRLNSWSLTVTTTP